MDYARRIRRLERIIAALALALVGVVTLGAIQQRPDKVEARTFNVVDRNGRLRACLGLDSEGNPALAILAEGSQDVRAILNHTAKDGVTLKLNGANVEAKAILAVGSDDNVTMSLTRKGTIGLAAGPESVGYVLTDAKDDERAGLSVGSDGKVVKQP